MPSHPRRRARRVTVIDGLKVRIIDDPAPVGAELDRALRTLARLMVRNHEAHGDHVAITDTMQSPSALTIAPNPRPDHDANEAA